MATTFSVGDRVRIRDWDDMASEFGVDEDGEISCKYIFAQSMRDFCGQEYTISTTQCAAKAVGIDTSVRRQYAGLAQLIERGICNLKVAGLSPAFGSSRFGGIVLSWAAKAARMDL